MRKGRYRETGWAGRGQSAEEFGQIVRTYLDIITLVVVAALAEQPVLDDAIRVEHV